MERIVASYSIKDQPDAAVLLRKWLEERKEPAELQDQFVWASSHDAREFIRERIAAADSFVAVWTSHAPESSWVLYHLGMAHALGKPITVLLAGGEPAALPNEIVRAANIVELEHLPA